MKTPCFALAVLATAASAAESIPFLNVVDTSKSCNKDQDCSPEDLSYIEGRGAPYSGGDICCASFPREMWQESTQSYQKTVTKHCYSKIILENRSEFNYYKQAYCDSALSGITYFAAVGVAVLAIFAF